MPDPTDRYKGDRLIANVPYYPGDYLLSELDTLPEREGSIDLCKQFAFCFRTDGSVAIYWKCLDGRPPDPQTPFDPGEGMPLWQKGGGKADDSRYFLYLQTDGNLCIYRGTSFQDNEGLVWEIGMKPEFSRMAGLQAVLRSTGQLQIISSENPDVALRTMAPEVSSVGIRRLVSIAKAQDGTALVVADLRPDGPDAARRNQGMIFPKTAVSVQAEGGLDSQLWRVYVWNSGSEDPGDLVVIINVASGRALTAGPQGSSITTSEYFNEKSNWMIGYPHVPGTHCITMVSLAYRNQSLGPNIFGNAPYFPGYAVISWPAGKEENLLWNLVPFDPKA